MEKEPALPKNIRQIGEISGREKICIEDYVMTWIHKRGQQEDKGYLGIFFGEQQETEDSDYVFIRGIFEVPAEIQEPQQQEAVRQEYEKYFGGWSVQGLCVIGAYPTERMKTLGAWIPESGRLIYHLQDQEETLYQVDEEQYRRLRGYFVFYEQNKRMQEYLSELFKDNSVEKESVPDRAIRSFREKVKEKAEQKQSSFLRMASSFFVITVLVVGAIVVNRVEDIRMARRLASTGDISEYPLQAEGENENSGASEEDAAAMSAAQYNAVQQAAEEAALTGSDVFWEKADPEDAMEQQEESGAEDSVSDAAQTAAEDSEPDAATAAEAEDSVSDAAQAVTESPASESVPAATENTESGQDETKEVSARHTQAGYVIREGDTLAKICSQYYGSIDYIAEICEANGIEDANMILPGQRIVLP